ncbi:mannitol dehydrogenase family protein [Telmatospirillum sp. J64-1]|uniref:mannitol dehydrogenase family protein n=1 Tax=Telmatospirillum sp. J64-1 TaxID=2502183 RepID=UPI00115CE650|nr:mannitol dehydrogenase family protein [Telmatospirillum sp. J64-1]
MTATFGRLDLGYDVGAICSGILHLGTGAFHRGHQAVYADDLLRSGETAWGITGLNVLPPDLTGAHAAQKGSYAVLARDGQGAEARAVSSLRAVHYRQDPNSGNGLDLLADPAMALVTLTITEKGYCHVPGTTRLDMNSAIAADVAKGGGACTAIGYLVEALRRRRAAGLPGLTVASCDNIPANGRLLRGVVLDYARRIDTGLADWIKDSVTFPCSMVDRIVPAMNDEARALLAEAAGCFDALGVVTEPFRQWVIEDAFTGPRPPLERVGVQVTDDVEAFELMKHRILNGVQTALAHVGWLSGFRTSAEASADPVLSEYALRFMQAQAKTLRCPPGEDLESYIAVSLQRLRNPTIHHPLEQIGTDSSFKVRQRLSDSTADLLRTGEAVELHALTLAAWMQYVGGVARDGSPVPVHDPLASVCAQIRATHADRPQAQVEGFLALDVFPEELRENGAFRSLTAEILAALQKQTPRDLLAGLLAAESRMAGGVHG